MNELIVKRKPIKKSIGEVYVICGCAKFLLDYLRMSHVGQFISVNQSVSLVFILIGLFLMLYTQKKL